MAEIDSRRVLYGAGEEFSDPGRLSFSRSDRQPTLEEAEVPLVGGAGDGLRIGCTGGNVYMSAPVPFLASCCFPEDLAGARPIVGGAVADVISTLCRLVIISDLATLKASSSSSTRLCSNPISSRTATIFRSTRLSTSSSIFSCWAARDCKSAFDLCNCSPSQVLSCFESFKAS
jgi:hypothetical protein